MKTFREFRDEAPALAETGIRLFYQEKPIAEAFLATVSAAGKPRLHPIFPVIDDAGLWFFIVEMSPKYRDLTTNGRFALHAMPTAAGGEEFYVTGQAAEITDETVKARVIASTNGLQGNAGFERLFECSLEHVLYTRWDNWGTEKAWPSYEKWHA